MTNGSLIFSIIFFVVFVLYCIFGGYTFYLNRKSSLNRVFFGVCISLCFWSVGFMIITASPTRELAFLGIRIAALGWGSMYSFLLHFILILTGKKAVLKKWWHYVLLYLPALISVYVYAFSGAIDYQQSALVLTGLGWADYAQPMAWDWFFNVYYVSFFGTGLALVWLWGRKSRAAGIKNQAKLLFYSFVVAIVLGTLTDKVLGFFITMPQVGPIIIVLPVTVIYYSIRRYGLMKAVQVNQDELILNEESRTKVYNYISIAFCAGGIIYFAAQYLSGYNIDDSGSVAGFVILMFVISACVQIVQHLKIKQGSKDLINISVIAVMIPVITLRFVQYASVTVWAFPMIVIIFSLVFNKRYVLLIFTVSILVTQVLVWIVASELWVDIKSVDYIERIGIFGIALVLAFYVNKIYVLRLKENSDQARLQKLVSEISTDFATLNQSNLDEKIYLALKKCGSFFKTDRAYVMMFSPERNTMTYRHEWCNEGITPRIGLYYEMPIDTFPYMKKHTQINDWLEITDIQNLPQEASLEKLELLRLGVRSMLAIPVISKNRPLGFLGFSSDTADRKWRDDHIIVIKVMANILADALARIRAEEEIKNMAYYDYLTKLPNRLMFKERVDQAIHLARRTEHLIGVMFLDIDYFKNINDNMGHEGGDELIRTIADVLSKNIRKSDAVSRFGGDEFLIMFNDVSGGENIAKIADHIMDQFKKPFVINNQEFFLTASAGIAVFPLDGENTETLVKNADIAMYRAKASGKNQYVMCTSDMKKDIQRKMKLTNSLYHALERDELFLNYQPQVNVKTGKIIGVEALIRWRHPELGIISPALFIPISEQTGLINPIGEWVLKTACRQNKMWQDAGLPTLRMAVNISVNQFRNPNLVNQVSGILKETGLNPGCLELEITESVAIHEAGYILNVLNNLKKLGITISIDDFGTDYSSLGRLKLLPVDRIKMDMNFVRGIEGSEKDKAITNVIISLAKNLGLKVIAEGVETKEQMAYLSRKMCDEVQGFYYYRPMDARDVEKILTV